MEQRGEVKGGSAAVLAYVNIEDLLRFAVRRWPYILVAGFLGAVALGSASWLVTPVYRATTVLMPAGDRGGRSLLGGDVGGFAALAGVNLGGSSASEGDVQFLKSRAFIGGFIEKHQLLPILFRDDLDFATGRWAAGREHTLQDGVRFFGREVMSVDADKKTKLIKISVIWREPAQAATWGNALVAEVNEQLRKKAVNATEANLEYLKKEMAATNAVALHQALARLIESETREAMLARGRIEYAFEVIDPAVTPDRFDRVRPRRTLMALFGGVFSGLFAFVVALFLVRRRALAEPR